MFENLILLPLLGVGFGVIAGFFGIGGGAVVVPIMVALGFSVKDAIGISVMQMLFGSVFGSYFNYKAGALKLGNGVVVGLGGFVGAAFSGYVVSIAPEIVLECMLLAVLLLSIAKIYLMPAEKDELKQCSQILLFLLGALTGAFAVSVGIGGAVFITPILVGFLGYKLKDAIGIGLFFVIFSSLSGFLSFAYHDQIRYIPGLCVSIGSIVGVYFGTKLSRSVQKQTLTRAFLGFYIIMSAIMIYKIFID